VSTSHTAPEGPASRPRTDAPPAGYQFALGGFDGFRQSTACSRPRNAEHHAVDGRRGRPAAWPAPERHIRRTPASRGPCAPTSRSRSVTGPGNGRMGRSPGRLPFARFCGPDPVDHQCPRRVPPRRVGETNSRRSERRRACAGQHDRQSLHAVACPHLAGCRVHVRGISRELVRPGSGGESVPQRAQRAEQTR